MPTGKFFSIEGLDGCGKSTQAQLLSEYLIVSGHRVMSLREPGGCPISEAIRSLLLNKKNAEMSPKTELLLYVSARAQLVEEIIGPALRSGQHLVADRFGWATLAYQGYGRGLNADLIKKLNDFVCGEMWPHHSFILDIPLSLMEERIRKTSQPKDRMELEDRQFFEKVRQGYLEIAKQNSGKITVLDGTEDIETIQERICAVVDSLIGKGNGI